MSEAPKFSCTRCEWKGDEPAITERNGDPVYGEDGMLHEPLIHAAICPVCYADAQRVDRFEIFSPGFMTRRQA